MLYYTVQYIMYLFCTALVAIARDICTGGPAGLGWRCKPEAGSAGEACWLSCRRRTHYGQSGEPDEGQTVDSGGEPHNSRHHHEELDRRCEEHM